MGLHRKTAGMLALVMGMTSVPAIPWNAEVKTTYASMMTASNEVDKKETRATMSNASSSVLSNSSNVSNVSNLSNLSNGSMSNKSSASMSNAIKFAAKQPKEIPPWYETVSGKEEKLYFFYGRDGEVQYRRYGGYSEEEDETWGWYRCTEEGAVSREEMIDIEQEFMEQAPYVYGKEEPSEEAWNILEEFLGEEEWEIEKQEAYGTNYDASVYDVWKANLNDGTEYYFYYGHPVNTWEESMQMNRWYICDEQGNIISFLLANRMMAAPRAMEIRNLEERITRNGDTVHIYLRGVACAQRPHLDGVFLFQNAFWSCTANDANPGHYSTGHTYEQKSGSSYRTVNVDFGYLIEMGSYCSGDMGRDGVTYTEENPTAMIWDGTYKDGKPDYSSSSSMAWAESVTWKGNYDYVYDNANGGSNVFEIEIAIKNPIPQFTGFAMQLWNGDRSDSESSFGYESIGNIRLAGDIASASSQAHTHTGNLVRTEATCVKAGSITGTCDLCKKEVSEVIPSLGHVQGNPVSEGGYTIVRCERCKEELSRQANSYQVTFHPNGGTVSPEKKSVTYQGTYGTLPVPKREFYRFDGWYTAATGGTAVTAASKYTTVGNQTLYAHWTRTESTFSFDANGGTGGGNLSGLHGTPFGILPSASREGYEFLGWFTAKEGGTLVTASSIVPEKEATYYAHWKICSYTARFHGNGGSDGASITKNYQEALGTLSESQRLGYLFQGWFTQNQGGSKITSQTKMPVGGADFFAQWKPITYKVHYTGNYASEGAMEDSVFTYDSKGNLTKNQYKKTGYVFIGWKDSQDREYQDGAEILNLTSVQGETLNLKAQWIPVRYTFVFYAGSGTGEPMGAQEHVYGQSQRLPENTYTKRGYHFTKWTTREDGTGDSFIDKKAIENYSSENGAEIALYAQWEPNTYKLRFESEGGTCSIRQKEVVFDAKVGELPIPKKLNYKFTGWYGAERKEMVTEDTIFTSDTDVILYASYELNYKEWENQGNVRPGADGEFGTEDDEYYFNGEDGIAGTEDDQRIHAGADGIYGTEDDFYVRENSEGGEDKIYAGQDAQFGTADDYRDLKNNTNQRPGDDLLWDTGDETIWWNGEDKKPGTADDWLIEKGKDGVYGTADDYVDFKDGTNQRPGNDLKWGSKDDLIAWNGADQKAGSVDDFIREEPSGEQKQAGEDCIFDTQDDIRVWDGADQKAGTEDDKIVYPGEDEIYGTRDDFYQDDSGELIYRGEETQFGKPNNFADHKDGTNTRTGENGVYDGGTLDDIKYLNGANQIPGDTDDIRIEKGEDGEYGTKDDYVDNGDGTNTRPGEDGIWGTDDDEHFTNGEDKQPGTEDDKPEGSTGTDSGKGDETDDGTDSGKGDETDDGTDSGKGDETDDGTDSGKGDETDDGTDSGKGDGADDDTNHGTSGGNSSGSSSSNGNGGGSSSSGGNGGSSSVGTKGSSISSGSIVLGFAEQGRWMKDEIGWWFQFHDGTYPKNSWQYLTYDNKKEWYHFDERGYMQTGWFRDVDEHWYHLHTQSDGTMGHMETGWFQDIDGLWYYLNPVSDGHKGAMTVGWRQIQDRWYYFNPVSNGIRGAMYAGTVTPDGYIVNEKGEWTGQRAEHGKNILSAVWKTDNKG